MSFRRIALEPSPARIATCAVCLLPLLAPAAGVLVDFNAANGTGEGPSQDALRTWSVAPSTQYARMNFDAAAPIFPANGQPQLYGGILVTNLASGGTVDFLRYHDNNPAGWPGAPKVLLATSSDGNPNNVAMAFVFKRPDFAGAPAKVAFDADSLLSLHLTDWNSGGGGTTWLADIRFLVRDNGQYYVSEAARTEAGAGDLTLDAFDNNATPGKRWTPATLTSTEFRIPASPSYQAVDFSDVTEVGWIGEGAAPYFRGWGFDTFQMTGTVVTDPAIGLSTASLTIPEQGSDSFTVVLGATPSGTVVLDVEGLDPAEATASPAQLTFTASDWNTPQTVTVQGVDDTTPGVNDTATVRVSVDAGETTATEYLTLDPLSVAVTLTNDDFSFLAAYRGSEMLAGGGIASSTAPTPDAGAWYDNSGNASPLMRVNFTESLIYPSASYGPARVSGGLELVEDLLGSGNSTFNNDGVYSGYANSFCLFGGDSDGTVPCRMRGVLLWNHADFAAPLANRPAAMGAGDWMSIRLAATLNAHDGTQETDGLRFVVRNAGIYYYSKTRVPASGGSAAPGTYGIADVAAEEWAVWDPTANPSTFAAGDVLPGGGTFATRTFDAVEAVGISFDCARAQYGSVFRFDQFLATGTDATPMGTVVFVR